MTVEKKGKTWRADSLGQLRQLYSAGVNATLKDQPETPWEMADVKPGKEPRGITTKKAKD